MNEPIPVSLAIRAVERAIRECDAATPGPWEECRTIVYTWDEAESEHIVTPKRDENEVFVVLARAGLRASLVYLLGNLADWQSDFGPSFRLESDAQIDTRSEDAAIAPLIAHYDANAPGWRTE